MTDAELNCLIRQVGRMNARATVEALLTGNDTQCFTTEQYMDKYLELHHKGESDKIRDVSRSYWLASGVARMHLAEWMKMREVKPDVWAMP